MMKNIPAPNASAKRTAAINTNPALAGKRGSGRGGRECKDSMGGNQMKKPHLKPLHCKVTPMTFFNLKKLAKMNKYGDNIGKVIDKLVRDRMVQLGEEKWEK